MPKWSLDPDPGGSAVSTPQGYDEATGGENLAAVLVVGKSQITRVVVSKIVERSGLRPVSESPENAQRTLSVLKPGTVILDGGVDNCDCNHLLATLSAQRRVSDRKVPRVILLSTRLGTPESLALGATVDAVVAKPITPEALQPVIDRLVEAARA
jgi:CheY-like chemotaxis protein